MFTEKLTTTVVFIFFMLSFALVACQPVSTASESESGGHPSGQSANNGLAQVVPTEQTLQDIPTTSEQSGVENLPAPVVATGIANNTRRRQQPRLLRSCPLQTARAQPVVTLLSIPAKQSATGTRMPSPARRAGQIFTGRMPNMLGTNQATVSAPMV